MHEQEWLTQELLQHFMEIMCVVRAGIYVDLVCAGHDTRVQNSCLYMCPARCWEDLDIDRWCEAAWISSVQSNRKFLQPIIHQYIEVMIEE
jgi:hypothetical protein